MFNCTSTFLRPLPQLSSWSGNLLWGVPPTSADTLSSFEMIQKIPSFHESWHFFEIYSAWFKGSPPLFSNTFAWVASGWNASLPTVKQDLHKWLSREDCWSGEVDWQELSTPWTPTRDNSWVHGYDSWLQRCSDLARFVSPAPPHCSWKEYVP